MGGRSVVPCRTRSQHFFDTTEIATIRGQRGRPQRSGGCPREDAAGIRQSIIVSPTFDPGYFASCLVTSSPVFAFNTIATAPGSNPPPTVQQARPSLEPPIQARPSIGLSLPVRPFCFASRTASSLSMNSPMGSVSPLTKDEDEAAAPHLDPRRDLPDRCRTR